MTNLMPVTSVLKGVNKAVKSFENKEKAIKKAHNDAVKITGFALWKILQGEIKKGKVGTEVHQPLSIIRSRLKSGRISKKAPLFFMAGMARYNSSGSGKSPRMDVGFLPGQSSRGGKNKAGQDVIKGSNKVVAEKYQGGFQVPITEKTRGRLAAKGQSISKRSPNRKFFFLKKTTVSAKVPERDIINPFWKDHKSDAKKLLPFVFEQKIKGVRVSSRSIISKIKSGSV